MAQEQAERTKEKETRVNCIQVEIIKYLALEGKIQMVLSCREVFHNEQDNKERLIIIGAGRNFHQQFEA